MPEFWPYIFLGFFSSFGSDYRYEIVHVILCLCIAEIDGGLVLSNLDNFFKLCITLAVSNLTRSLN